MIQTPIRQVLLTIQKHQVLALLMGGQACVFYGAVQFSRDVDFLILADESNFIGLHAALEELQAVRIAVPRFDPDVLQRGHAVHFRCQAAGVEGLRIDVMTRLRDLEPFEVLWARRTTIATDDGGEVHLLSVPDLVNAKKTQRAKDWPMIDALVEGHYLALGAIPTPARILFWLAESRTPERLIDLTARFPAQVASALVCRPLLALALAGDLPDLRVALDAEARANKTRTASTGNLSSAKWRPSCQFRETTM